MEERADVPKGYRSGVFPSSRPERLARLSTDLRASMARLEAMKADAAAPSATGAEPLAIRAVRELEAVHGELRMAEEELYAQAQCIVATRALLEHERRVYGELFEAAPDAYVVTDECGVITYASRRAASVFQQAPAILIGKPLAALIVQDDRQRFYDALASAAETTSRVALHVSREPVSAAARVVASVQRSAHGGGAPANVRWLLRIEDEPGSVEGEQSAREAELSHQVHELTAANRAQAHLLERERAALREANESCARARQVLAEVAHGMRSALAPVAARLHVLDSARSPLDRSQPVIDSMTRNVRALAALVDDLIEHARLERYQVALSTARRNLVRLVAEVVEDMRPLAALRRISIQLDASTYDVPIHADAMRLQQAIRNVLGNAIKFNRDGGAVRIEINVADGCAELAVADRGQGIASERLPHIFAPFTQARGASSSGLGLGLSIAQRIIEMHGGSMRAESKRLGAGAVFRLRLPLDPAAG